MSGGGDEWTVVTGKKSKRDQKEKEKRHLLPHTSPTHTSMVHPHSHQHQSHQYHHHYYVDHSSLNYSLSSSSSSSSPPLLQYHHQPHYTQPQSQPQQAICKFFQNGYCSRGSQCHFLHTTSLSEHSSASKALPAGAQSSTAFPLDQSAKAAYAFASASTLASSSPSASSSSSFSAYPTAHPIGSQRGFVHHKTPAFAQLDGSMHLRFSPDRDAAHESQYSLFPPSPHSTASSSNSNNGPLFAQSPLLPVVRPSNTTSPIFPPPTTGLSSSPANTPPSGTPLSWAIGPPSRRSVPSSPMHSSVNHPHVNGLESPLGVGGVGGAGNSAGIGSASRSSLMPFSLATSHSLSVSNASKPLSSTSSNAFSSINFDQSASALSPKLLPSSKNDSNSALTLPALNPSPSVSSASLFSSLAPYADPSFLSATAPSFIPRHQNGGSSPSQSAHTEEETTEHDSSLYNNNHHSSTDNNNNHLGSVSLFDDLPTYFYGAAGITPSSSGVENRSNLPEVEASFRSFSLRPPFRSAAGQDELHMRSLLPASLIGDGDTADWAPSISRADSSSSGGSSGSGNDAFDQSDRAAEQSWNAATMPKLSQPSDIPIPLAAGSGSISLQQQLGSVPSIRHVLTNNSRHTPSSPTYATASGGLTFISSSPLPSAHSSFFSLTPSSTGVRGGGAAFPPSSAAVVSLPAHLTNDGYLTHGQQPLGTNTHSPRLHPPDSDRKSATSVTTLYIPDADSKDSSSISFLASSHPVSSRGSGQVTYPQAVAAPVSVGGPQPKTPNARATQPALSYSSVVKLAHSSSSSSSSSSLDPPSIYSSFHMDNSMMHPGDSEQYADPQADFPETDAKVCIYFLQSNCRYGQYCRYSHNFGLNCPNCQQPVPAEEQEQHLATCEETILQNEERRASHDLTCGICMDNVLGVGRRFGLLSECNHSFCLQCIREWRANADHNKENVRACPICRTESFYVTPCDRMVTNVVRKQQVLDQYRERLSKIPCMHFSKSKGSCPFGSSCFYAHLNEDGTEAIVEPNYPRLRENADGEITVTRPVRLSDFL